MAQWERPFSGLPPTHSDLFRFLQQEQLLSGCTTQHIGQNFEGDRPRKGLVKWLERVEWLESYQELDENEASWDMVRVKYEIVACWAGIPVFKWRSDTPARPPETPAPPWKTGKPSKKAQRKKRRRDETCTVTPAASSKDRKGRSVQDESDSDS